MTGARLAPGGPVAGGAAAARVAAPEVSRGAGDRGGPTGGFRPDIEGLRAVAVLAVVLYHARVPFLTGGYVGVDVFYVISGFVVTMVLLREFTRTGSISILGFYARRARRLLPAAVLTLIATLAAAWWWLPLQLPWIATQAIASATYSVNFLLARNSVDYLDTMRRESPLEHFWSLAVEEQFYLVWPLLLVALLVRRRGRGTDPRLVLGTVLVLAALSFVLCVWLTGRSPGYAYFGSPPRAWELLAGALLAFGARTVGRVPARVAAGLTWAGLAAVAAAALLFDGLTRFPGYAALLPVLGAAMVIAGGCAPHHGGAGGLLGTRVLQWVGRRSYSWYLWHWPFLVIGTTVLGGSGTLWQSLGLAGGALVAAALTYALVEDPVRRIRSLERARWRTVGLAAAASAAVVVVAMPALVRVPSVTGPGAPVDTAAVLATPATAERDLLRLVAASAEAASVPVNLDPPLPDVAADIPAVFRDGCVVLETSQTGTDHPCVYGDPAGRRTVVLFGDSHAGSWFPALQRVAVERGWRLIVMVKGFCSAASVRFHLDSINRPFDECVEWRRRALERIAGLRPWLVVTSSTNHSFGDPVGGSGDRDRTWTDGWARTMARIRSAGGEVVYVGDVPWLPPAILDCLALHLADARTCHTSVRDAVLEPRRRRLIEQTATGQGAMVIDPTPWFCTSTTCPAVVGNVVTLRDGNHISATYSRLLWRVLDERIGRVRS